MPRLIILSPEEIQAFDKPPRFTTEQRQKYFELTHSLQTLLPKLRTPTNKVCMVIHWGYFRATGRFFLPKDFRRTDIDYVANHLMIDPHAIDLADYCQKPKIFRDHERTVLKAMLFRPFDQTDKALLYERIQIYAEKQMQPREMIYFLAAQLHQQKIEIPGYHTFNEAITKIYNQVEAKLLEIIDATITEQQKVVFLGLIESADKQNEIIKLSAWKDISQSLQVKDIRQSIETFQEVKSLFYQCLPLFQVLALSSASCEYYATWLKKARLSQIRQFPDKNKLYLHIAAFIQHQFYARQDVFIDILLKSAQSIHNQAVKKLLAEEKAKRKERLSLVETLADNQARLEALMAEITAIVQNEILTDSNKVEQIKFLLQRQNDANASAAVANNQISPSQQIKKLLQDDAYYDVLEKLSVQLQNRVSDIIKYVDFNEVTSDADIIAAINYYKLHDGNLGKDVPIAFLDTKERKVVYGSNNKLRVSLYKALLFLNMASLIKSGHLNLKYSYRYKAIQDYLIDKTTWDQSREILLKSAGLEAFADVDTVLFNLKTVLDAKYHAANQHINQGKNTYIKFDKDGSFILETPKIEKNNTESISDLLAVAGFVPIIQVLKDVNHACGFTEAFRHYSVKHHKLKPEVETIIAGIMSQGHNLGIHKISSISIGINSNTLRQTVTWFFTLKNLQTANNKIVAMINKLALSSLFKYSPQDTHTSSDGQKYQVIVDSLLANYSFKYFGKDKGVSVYTFIDDRHALFYSTVISASEREALYVIDGLIHNDVVRSAIHSTDMHGFSESVFAGAHFMGTSLAPRLKQLNSQYIYGFSARQTYAKKGYKILPTRTINTAIIRQHWDDILRFIASIKLKETTASQLFKRLSSYAKDHPLYKAIKEFGRIIKTLYILAYIDDVGLRQRIEKQLNRIELSNKFAKAVFFDKNREFQVATKEEQEIVVACKVLIQNAIVLWNYLYLSQLLASTDDQQQKVTILNTIRQGSLISWEHINMQGEYDFIRTAANAPTFDMEKIWSLRIGAKAA